MTTRDPWLDIFCPSCEAILPLPDLRDYIVCRVCTQNVDATVYDGLDICTIKEYNKVDTKEKTKNLTTGNQDVADGPVVDRKCSKCGHEQMSYATLQLRSADEGQTVFYTCLRCKHKDIENS